MFLQQLKARKDWQGYLLSALFALLLAVHLLSSDIVVAGKQQAHKQSAPLESLPRAEMPAVVVDIRQVKEEVIEKELQLYGRTHANRKTQIKTERAARVERLNYQQGQVVEAGETVITLDAANLKKQLLHAQALLKQRELEYDSAQRLQAQGHQARLIVAEKATQLAQAGAQLADLQTRMADTTIQSPYKGVLNKTYVEQGEYVAVGDAVAEVLELNPLIVKIHVPETVIADIALGQLADIAFLDGLTKVAKVAYIAASSEVGTNTFAVELALDNSQFDIPAGISARVTLKTGQLLATSVSPAYLTLNHDGQSGIYVVENDVAKFKRASILKSNAKQLWVESLGENAQIIIAGHQSILEGMPVKLRQASQPSDPIDSLSK